MQHLGKTIRSFGSQDALWKQGGNILIDADTPVVRNEDPLSPRVLLTMVRECSPRNKVSLIKPDNIVPEASHKMVGGMMHTLNIACGGQTTVKQLAEYLLKNFPADAMVDLDCDHDMYGPTKTLEVYVED